MIRRDRFFKNKSKKNKKKYDNRKNKKHRVYNVKNDSKILSSSSFSKSDDKTIEKIDVLNKKFVDKLFSLNELQTSTRRLILS